MPRHTSREKEETTMNNEQQSITVNGKVSASVTPAKEDDKNGRGTLNFTYDLDKDENRKLMKA